MEVITLNDEYLERFRQYCKTHRHEVDESFIGDQELDEFNINNDNPTYLLMNNDDIVGVLSVMIDDYYKRGKRARIRIFHTIYQIVEAYQLLWNQIQFLKSEFNDIYLFVHENNKTIKTIVEHLQFEFVRYTYVLECHELYQQPVILPVDYKIKPIEFNQDEEDWCLIRNDAFVSQQVSDYTPELVRKCETAEGYIEGGMMLLYHHEQPVGLLQVSQEDENTTYIGPIAVIKKYQRQGLGRLLIKISKEFSQTHQFKNTILVVHSDNDKAISLYLSEGFIKTSAVIQYNYKF